MAPTKAIDMIVAAIVGLKERDGASQEAIIKYIGANNDVDIAKVGPHVRRALKSGVTQGKLTTTKKGLYKASPAVASASISKQEKAKTAKKPAAKKIATVSHSKIVKQKPLTPKKAAATGGKKKGPVSSKPKSKKKGGGKKAGKKQQPKKAAGKKGGKKK